MEEVTHSNENPQTEAGTGVQFGIAKALVDIIGRNRFTPDTIKVLSKPLNMGIHNKEGALLEQEIQTRETMARFIGMVAWIAADGDPEKAQHLIGSDLEQHDVDIASPKFTSAMQYMLDRSRR